MERLAKLAEGGERKAIPVLIEFARLGSWEHLRSLTTSALADLAVPGDAVLGDFFLEGLSCVERGYWSVKGAVGVLGRGAYPYLVDLALNEEASLEARAHSVKCLARDSGQPFDRELSHDPGYWQLEELRLEEIRAWAASGFPEGTGHPVPSRHPALDAPKTRFEALVARLDQALLGARLEEDPANPSSRLVPAPPDLLAEIRARWELPEAYLDFLTRFSPLRVHLPQRELEFEEEDFLPEVTLVGAWDFAYYQEAFAQDPTWPEERVVLALQNGDPYSMVLGDDAVYFSMDDADEDWEFEVFAPSFEGFLRILLSRFPD